MAISTYQINSSRIVLTTGAYLLQWGTLDQQQLGLSNIVIVADAAEGSISIILPDANDARCYGVTFSVAALKRSPAGEVGVSVIDDNTLNGDSGGVAVENGMAAEFKTFGYSNWVYGSGVK